MTGAISAASGAAALGLELTAARVYAPGPSHEEYRQQPRARRQSFPRAPSVCDRS